MGLAVAPALQLARQFELRIAGAADLFHRDCVGPGRPRTDSGGGQNYGSDEKSRGNRLCH